LRFTCYTGKTKGFFAFPRGEIMDNFFIGPNIGLITPKQTKENVGAFITKKIAGHKSFSAYDKSSVFPLYIYFHANNQQTIDQRRTPNLKINSSILLPLDLVSPTLWHTKQFFRHLCHRAKIKI
jgi:hypothetical protein